MDIVTVGGRERVLVAPDFLQHQIGALIRLQFFGRIIHVRRHVIPTVLAGLVAMEPFYRFQRSLQAVFVGSGLEL